MEPFVFIKWIIVLFLILPCLSSEPTYPSWPWDFRWENLGDLRNDTCVRVYENLPWFHKWDNNYFCVNKSENLTDPGMLYSRAGTIDGMTCVTTKEPASPWGWQNNYLCFNNDVPYDFTWSHMGCIKDKACIHWLELGSPLEESWRDNYLCATPWPNTNKTYEICSNAVILKASIFSLSIAITISVLLDTFN